MPHGHCCDFRRDSSPENPFEFICLLYPARRDHAVKCAVPRVLLHAMISIPVRSFQTYEYPKSAPISSRSVCTAFEERGRIWKWHELSSIYRLLGLRSDTSRQAVARTLESWPRQHAQLQS